MGTFHIRIQLFPNLRGGCYSQACWKHLIYTTDKHTLGVSNFFCFFLFVCFCFIQCTNISILFKGQMANIKIKKYTASEVDMESGS